MTERIRCGVGRVVNADIGKQPMGDVPQAPQAYWDAYELGTSIRYAPGIPALEMARYVPGIAALGSTCRA